MGILSSRNCYNDIVLEKIKSPNNILTLSDPHQKQMNLSQGAKKSKIFFIDSRDGINSKDTLLRIYKIGKLFISCLRWIMWGN